MQKVEEARTVEAGLDASVAKGRQEKDKIKEEQESLDQMAVRKFNEDVLGRGNKLSAKEAGCQGSGCGAYE